jgi:energy-coupling factor transporter ATP-binding protein EcfA2
MTREIPTVPPIAQQSRVIGFNSSTVTWPQERIASKVPRLPRTPQHRFVLDNLNLDFPLNELSLVCGKLGSGKTLLLLGAYRLSIATSLLNSVLALLGEVDVLAGQVFCPRSPANSLALLHESATDDDWIVLGMTAYVPQVSISPLPCLPSFMPRRPLGSVMRPSKVSYNYYDDDTLSSSIRYRKHPVQLTLQERTVSQDTPGMPR